MHRPIPDIRQRFDLLDIEAELAEIHQMREGLFWETINAQRQMYMAIKSQNLHIIKYVADKIHRLKGAADMTARQIFQITTST